MASETATAGRDFIRDIVDADLNAGGAREVVTRFPPEPNGYLHIGHAKAIGLDFDVPRNIGGRCHLRFDDTNPAKEEQEFIDSIKRDVHGLDSNRKFCIFIMHRIILSSYTNGPWPITTRQGVCLRPFAGGHATNSRQPDRPGQDSPYRDRTVAENLDLFGRMRNGEFPNGARVLRAKIDMASGNIKLRDPVLYRILHTAHPRTGKTWCIYPSYDFAHGQSDAIEGVTHSLCTLEFEDHRPLYDWLLDNLPVPSRPRQYEFARLNINYTVLSKRFLTELVRQGRVTAGTIRACRPWPGCGGAACRRRRSAISPVGSASRAPTASSISACSNTRCANI